MVVTALLVFATAAVLDASQIDLELRGKLAR